MDAVGTEYRKDFKLNPESDSGNKNLHSDFNAFKTHLPN